MTVPVNCPFCNSDEITTVPGLVSDYVAECENCGALGPHAVSPADALSAWNQRAPQLLNNGGE